MDSCSCRDRHEPVRVVLTGGPGAGKTAVLEMARQSFCKHVTVLTESAGIVFGGGFPRNAQVEVRKAAQRAIFFVQRELEATAEGNNAALVLCDRGTVDGFAYWPGPEDFWSAVGTSLEEQLGRYHAVIHLRTPTVTGGYNRINPLRTEAAGEAALIDQHLATAWETHPRRFVVDATVDFLTKASRVLEILRDETPECCRPPAVP